MTKRRNVAVGTVLVAGLAYAAGILTAPKSGRETRKDIRRKTQQAKTEAERRLKQAHSELNELIDKANKFAQSSKSKLSEEWNAALRQAEKVRQKTRELLSAIHEGEAEDKDLQAALDEIKTAAKHLKQYALKQNVSKKTK